MGIYVAQGAKLHCSCGEHEGSLRVRGRKVFINGQPQANAEDHLPLVNIPSFGLCSSLANPTVAAATAANRGKLKKMMCVPNTPSLWLAPRDEEIICGAPALLETSVLRCAYCGVIKINDHGQ